MKDEKLKVRLGLTNKFKRDLIAKDEHGFYIHADNYDEQKLIFKYHEAIKLQEKQIECLNVIIKHTKYKYLALGILVGVGYIMADLINLIF